MDTIQTLVAMSNMDTAPETKMLKPHITSYKCLKCLLTLGLMRTCATSACKSCVTFLSSGSLTYCIGCAHASKKCEQCGKDLQEAKVYLERVIAGLTERIDLCKNSSSQSMKKYTEDLQQYQKLILEYFLLQGDIPMDKLHETYDAFMTKVNCLDL